MNSIPDDPHEGLPRGDSNEYIEREVTHSQKWSWRKISSEFYTAIGNHINNLYDHMIVLETSMNMWFPRPNALMAHPIISEEHWLRVPKSFSLPGKNEVSRTVEKSRRPVGHSINSAVGEYLNLSEYAKARGGQY
jgi:hypothetical protein